MIDRHRGARVRLRSRVIVGLVIWSAVVATLLALFIPMTTRAHPARPGSNSHSHTAHAQIVVGPSGWSGDSLSSDPVNGWGDDQWQINPTQLMQVTVGVTDCCIVGDNYSVYIDGHLIGTTPAEPLNGSTFSSGSFSADVAPGTHRISIRDIGGVTYYDQGATFMFPAGYSVSISLAPASIRHPIIFVHGIGENGADVGTKDFGPLYLALQESIYAQDAPTQANKGTFFYVDDRGFTACPQRACDSQSEVLTNSLKLATIITQDYASAHHKVALIGYSMGATIIRNLLAGCPLTDDATCKSALGEVDDVFFIEGVQQGSILMWIYQGVGSWAGQIVTLNPTAPVAIGLDAFASDVLAPGMHLDLGNPAEPDLAPESDRILLQNAKDPPLGIHYFNFYGDIQLVITRHIWHWQVASATLSVGDFAILPGTDNPREAPRLGGSRFCLSCTAHDGYESAQIDANTSYTEWALSDSAQVTTEDVAACLPSLRSILGVPCLGGNTLPEMHLNIAHPESLSGPGAILVRDTTGASQMATIPVEIVRQIEVQDGVIP